MFQGRIIDVRIDKVKLPNGKEASREVVEHPGGVTIIPVMGNEVILVEQFRKPANKCLLELPAGKLEEGETPAFCAERELIEEIGFKPGKLDFFIFILYKPGF